MTPPPLAIVQARIGSTRLPGKMLLPLGGKPVVMWAVDAAIKAFGAENVVATVPDSPENDELAAVLGRVVAVVRSARKESDVLGRLSDAAYMCRWEPESVCVRVTPDDWRKDPAALRRVAAGARLPVEIGGEACTLHRLRTLDWTVYKERDREHVSFALYHMPTLAAPADGLPWSIDSQSDYDAAVAHIEAIEDDVAAFGGRTPTAQPLTAAWDQQAMLREFPGA
jgi:spore coat polysaccharide biosynthesis protein SpsF